MPKNNKKNRSFKTICTFACNITAHSDQKHGRKPSLTLRWEHVQFVVCMGSRTLLHSEKRQVTDVLQPADLHGIVAEKPTWRLHRTWFHFYKLDRVRKP